MKGSFKKGSFKTVSITDKDLFNMHTNYRIVSPHTSENDYPVHCKLHTAFTHYSFTPVSVAKPSSSKGVQNASSAFPYHV